MSTTLNDINLTNATGVTQGPLDSSSNLATTAFVQSLLATLGVSASLGSNGWLKVGGVMIQWGSCVGQAAVTFPTAFPNGCFAVNLTAQYSSGDSRIVAVEAGTLTATGFVMLVSGGATGIGAYFIAIGH